MDSNHEYHDEIDINDISSYEIEPEIKIRKIDILLKMLLHTVVKDDEHSECICSYESKNTKTTVTETEIIPGLEVDLNKNEDIELKTVIDALKKNGFPISEGLIQVYNYIFNVYVSYGNEIQNAILSENNGLIHNDVVNIKCTCIINETYMPFTNPSAVEFNKTLSSIIEKQKQNNELEQLIKRKNEESLRNEGNQGKKNKGKKAEKDKKGKKGEDADEIISKEPEKPDKQKKTTKSKEAKISYVIEVVYQWRKLFNGFYNNKNEYIKLSLEDAADALGISKKTLDDFLRQLRLGRKLNYDFNKYCAEKNENIGILRNYVKERNEENKDKTKVKKEKKQIKEK